MCTSECHPSRTCSLLSSELCAPPDSSVIDLEATTVKFPKAPVWINLGNGQVLLMEDKYLIESGKWLNDRIISAWEFLLQQKYPSVGGLHSTVKVSKRRFKREPQKREIVQVLNSGNNHWVVISTIGCSVGVVHWLDSLHCRPTTEDEMVIADLLQCSRESIQIKVLNVQVQSGGECGLFALANATAALKGLDLSGIRFNQKRMRSHLVACLQQKDPKPFPLEVKVMLAQPLKVLNTYAIKIYCVCRLPESGLMVMCMKCLKWFHKNCTTLRATPEEEIQKIDWKCATCIAS